MRDGLRVAIIGLEVQRLIETISSAFSLIMLENERREPWAVVEAIRLGAISTVLCH